MLKAYYNINKAIGVSINISQDGNVKLHACEVTVENNRLNIEGRIKDLETVEELVKHFAPKSFIALNICGKGILQKLTESIKEINQNNFTQILPNAKFEDFYIQNFLSGNKSFISIIRTAEADRWITSLSDLGFIVCQMSLGPFPVNNILPQLNSYDNNLKFNGHVIERNDQHEWLSYKHDKSAYSPFPLKVETEPIDEKLVVAYANAFQLVLNNKLKSIKADVSLLALQFDKVISERKLRIKAFILLCGFFILLLANFIALCYLNSSNIKLTQQINQSSQFASNLQGINDGIKAKEVLLKNLGWDGGINKSKLIDQIAILLPDYVFLNKITINPIVQENIRVERSLKFADRIIHISGTSDKIMPVNEWIARIKNQKWVKNVQLVSYSFNTEQSTGQFIIVINF